ncbi:PEP-CTERM sorting domain-containing protein [Crocosphaera chwakensis]|uniref:Ice-binding protein C-terminal domain-containing protein n=1 Tax=Crocosphaera chwakensis CCY0110 TaxID=391612 RepID=A3IV69_9CHRO|nr:PEP-CTERM sorting domain-containing protein [Crocosphaera chwakensis]EAZ89630.1 hypothetical protein CY0110_24396 [Crocosphaera chwakensis CCY0110]
MTIHLNSLGIIASASIAALSLVIGPTAQAQTFIGNFNGTIKDATTITFGGMDYTAVQTENVLFDNFNFDGTFFGDDLEIGFSSLINQYFFDFNPVPSPDAINGSFSYDITGDQTVLPNGNVVTTLFNFAALDSDVQGPGVYQVTKNVITSEGQVINLTSTNGSTDDSAVIPLARTLRITDSLSSNGDVIFSLTNSYTTVEEFTPAGVPEPGTMIGLLVIGAAGLATRRKVS